MSRWYCSNLLRIVRQGGGHRTHSKSLWTGWRHICFSFSFQLLLAIRPFSTNDTNWAFQGCLLFCYNFDKDIVQYVSMPILTHRVSNENTINNINTPEYFMLRICTAIVQDTLLLLSLLVWGNSSKNCILAHSNAHFSCITMNWWIGVVIHQALFWIHSIKILKRDF